MKNQTIKLITGGNGAINCRVPVSCGGSIIDSDPRIENDGSGRN